MSLRKTRGLALHRLEDRTTPSVSVSLVSGTLTIRSDNLPNSLLISESAPGKFAVSNNSKAVGTFSFSNLNVTMGNGADTVELKLATALTGNLNVTLGNGTDTFTTANSTLGSRLGGNAYINLGLGGNRPGINYDQVAVWYNANIGGNLTVLGSAGSGAELLDVEATRIGGTLSGINIFQTALGDVVNGARAVFVGRDVTVTNVQKNTDARSDTPPLVGGNGLNLYNLSTVNRDVFYTGGSGIDRVQLPQDILNANAPVFINGNVQVNGGGGANLFSLGAGRAGFPASAFVGGSVTYTGGVGVDRVYLDTGSVVDGNVLFDLGEGDNEIFNGPVDSGTVNGDLTIRAGNGDNILGAYSALLSVGGNLTIQFGNGDNAPSTFFNTSLSVGGTAKYQAGTGSNSLDITNETIGDLVLLFSGGPTTVLFNQASGVFSGDVYLDFGVGFGPKVLGGSAALTGNVTILNYP